MGRAPWAWWMAQRRTAPTSSYTRCERREGWLRQGVGNRGCFDSGGRNCVSGALLHLSCLSLPLAGGSPRHYPPGVPQAPPGTQLPQELVDGLIKVRSAMLIYRHTPQFDINDEK